MLNFFFYLVPRCPKIWCNCGIWSRGWSFYFGLIGRCLEWILWQSCVWGWIGKVVEIGGNIDNLSPKKGIKIFGYWKVEKQVFLFCTHETYHWLSPKSGIDNFWQLVRSQTSDLVEDGMLRTHVLEESLHSGFESRSWNDESIHVNYLKSWRMRVENEEEVLCCLKKYGSWKIWFLLWRWAEKRILCCFDRNKKK